MIEIDWSRAATVPRQHQKEGVRWLVTDSDPARGRVIPCVYLLADEVGAGKSKQGVDASQLLFEDDRIDTVVVLGPSFARGVWANPDPVMGEVAKHGWPSVPNHVIEYSVNHDRTLNRPLPKGELFWIVTNYEFVRRPNRLLTLARALKDRRYWLICDEAWALSDHTTAQWEAAAALRHHGWIRPTYLRKDPVWREIHSLAGHASRVTLLNGSPVADTPLDLFAQMRLLHRNILKFQYFSHFRARYALLKPNVSFPMITGWQNLEELRARVEPYVLRRLTRECFDLPDILEPITIEAKLSEATWKIYKQMRDDMVAWIDESTASVAKQALTKGLRLSQITSGFLGGLETVEDDGSLREAPGSIQEIGTEKLDALHTWLRNVYPRPDRVLIWSRFRPEIERTARSFEGPGPDHRRMHLLYGGITPEARAAAERALHPDVPVEEPTGVVGNPAAGGAALNLAGASLAVTLSDDFSLRIWIQKRGRIDRPGQRNKIRYVDIIATGPQGQKTINHHTVAALRSKDDIARWTTATWRNKLLEE